MDIIFWSMQTVFEWQWWVEFNNEGNWKMNENLNIKTCTTAVENQFCKGNMECHNLIFAEAMEKMLEE